MTIRRQPSLEDSIADYTARCRSTYDDIVRQSESIHPADRASFVQHRAEAAGLPATMSKPIYGTISRNGGVNHYTHDELVRGVHKR